MASDPTQLLQGSPADRANSAAPLAGTRSQSVQRLQVGLFGLAAMVLLVGLASIINHNAEQSEAGVVPEAAAPVAAAQADAPPPSDPLADAGVVPDMPAAARPPVSASGDAPPPPGP